MFLPDFHALQSSLQPLQQDMHQSHQSVSLTNEGQCKDAAAENTGHSVMTAHTVPKVPMVPTEQGPGPLAMPMSLVHGS